MMRHDDQLGDPRLAEPVESGHHQPPVRGIESLARFIEHEQRRLADEGAGDQGESLLAGRQAPESRVFESSQLKLVQHRSNAFPLSRRQATEQTHRVEQA